MDCNFKEILTSYEDSGSSSNEGDGLFQESKSWSQIQSSSQTNWEVPHGSPPHLTVKLSTLTELASPISHVMSRSYHTSFEKYCPSLLIFSSANRNTSACVSLAPCQPSQHVETFQVTYYMSRLENNSRASGSSSLCGGS